MRFGWAARLALQRLLAQWRSLLTVIAGVLLSAAVGGLIPLYSAAVAQVSMVEWLNQQPPDTAHALVSLSLIPSKTAPTGEFASAVQTHDARLRDLVQRHLADPFPGWLHTVSFYGETSALDVLPAASTDQVQRPSLRALVAYYEGWPDTLSLVAGRLPSDTPANDADIEIVVPLEAQDTLGVNIDDRLTLDQGGPSGGWPTSVNVVARVVGIVSPPEQMTPLERAYLMSPSPLRVTPMQGDYRAEFPVLTTRAAFERVAIRFVPDTPTRFGWRLQFDHTRLPFSRSPEARAALLDFSNAIAATFRDEQPEDLGLIRQGQLIDWAVESDQNIDRGLLLAFERSVRSLDAPFSLLLLQVGALVLFFLLVTAALVRRGERREIAMLQSRGAADGTLVMVRGLEALILCGAAALIAPLIAQQVLILITPFFARYPNLPLLLTPTVFVYSAVASAAAFGALMFTLRPVLRLPLITSGGSTLRSEREPWWQRYYVDVVVAVLGMGALLRLVSRETPLFTTSAGGSATDPFLLLAPALLFLGLGSILLRLFPALARIAARTLAGGRGLVGPMATWQLSREPLHYGRITFLLALAIGIGWFATSFRATVARSQNDQAQYRVGTDIRLTERDMRLNVARGRPAEAYTAVPGVQAATLTWRQRFVNFQGDPSKSALLGQLLAVDPATFRKAIVWRPDLGVVNVPDGAPKLPETGAELPFAPQKLRLWARFDVWNGFTHVPDLDRLRNRTTLFARLHDSAGMWLNIPFRPIEIEYVAVGPQSPGAGGGGAFVTSGWAYLEADLTAVSYQPTEPLRLSSIYWQHRGRGLGGERFLRMTLGGLAGIDATGELKPIDMLSRDGWEFVYDSGAFSQGNATPGYIDAQRGNGIGTMWDQSAETARVGLLLEYPEIGPVPMLASRALVAQLGLQPGQTIQVRNLAGLTVPFRVEIADGVGQAYYPTLYDGFQRDGKWLADSTDYPFVVADRDSLLYALNRRPSAAVYADEVWLKTAPDADRAAVLEAARPADRSTTFVTAQTLSGELENLQTDPLSRGLLGLMFLAFIVAMALSIVGLLTYAALTASARRAEFGVLRALGLSSLRVIGQLALEQVFVIGLGTLLGAILGGILSGQVVPRLAQDASGAQITPPFIVQVESAALLQYGLLIVGVLALVMAVSLVLVRQLSLSRSLRLGEE